MAMHCPRCSTEYRDGFSECTDCRVPLAPGPPPARRPAKHDVDLVTVLESSDPFVLNLAKATLEDAGIRYVEEGDDANERGLTGMAPAGALASQLQVESARAAHAREVLEPLLNPEPISETEGEAEAEK
jgi:hypothetical protein